MKYTAIHISVIITCYKEQELLLRAYESLQQQSVQGFEIVLINDCSPDIRTNEICDTLAQTSHIRYFKHEKNGGLSAARNTGFKQMTGLLAVPLDADDTLPYDAIEQILLCWNQYPDADMLWGNYAIIHEHNTITIQDCSVLRNADNTLNPYALAENWCLIGTSPCLKKTWELVEGYNLKHSNTTQDVNFWRRAFLKNIKGYYIPFAIYNWFRCDTGMNSQVQELDYVQLREDSMLFYDTFNPHYAQEMRNYIYRYYSQRLMKAELHTFVAREKQHLSASQVYKAWCLSRFPFLYKILRTLKNMLLCKK